MAYNDFRSYVNVNVPAQNVVATASGAVVTNANVVYLPTAEASFITSIAAACVTTNASQSTTFKVAVLNGTSTIATCTLGGTATVGMAAFATNNPATAVSSGVGLGISLVSTGTASATQTSPQFTVAVGLAPQYV